MTGFDALDGMPWQELERTAGAAGEQDTEEPG
jgi:hypothetical protein